MKASLAMGLVLGFFLVATSSRAAGASQGTPNNELVSITIGVYDYAHATPSVLLEAEQTAAAILMQAGVKAVWLACPTEHASPRNPACAALEDPSNLTVRILPDSMSKPFHSRHGNALGFSILSAQFSSNAWVLYGQLTDYAVRQRLPFGRLLGYVIAHEMGHLLLGENAHTEAGLMHSHWSPRELLAMRFAQLVFSDTECRLIHSGVIARRQTASAAVAAASSLSSGVAR